MIQEQTLSKLCLSIKKYKEVADELLFFEASQRKISFRGNTDADPVESPPEYETLLKNITIYDLAKAFKNIIQGIKEKPVHEIKKINISIDEQIQYILDRVNEMKEIHFLSLIHGMREKIRIVITFIALLELVKMHKIGIKASSNFNDFIMYSVNNG